MVTLSCINYTGQALSAYVVDFVGEIYAQTWAIEIADSIEVASSWKCFEYGSNGRVFGLGERMQYQG